MSVWRRKALELFYDARFHFTQKDDTVYSLLLELHIRLDELHRNNNTFELTKIYNYVEWCFHQGNRSHYLCNAAAVGFYEHLVDDEITRNAIPYWVKPDIFEAVQSFFEWRLENKLALYIELVMEYNKINNTQFIS
ncbi:hypothetical protein A3842_23825 [Paenibacillus sp. P3E]|uniref:DUF7674 family protein n=1 Tax=Paenibacillus sp. P3E TaxID=1349435 RepID=UPI0009394B9A|nr:hypothetical protein [Paenibacillus sp. P3E]OKP71510.1 hypothetical protein A3842_23825 [Paenibacillus sp. P3E]